MTPGPGYSVSKAVSLTLIAATTVILAAFGILDYRHEREHHTARLHETLNGVSGQLAHSIVRPLWDLDTDQIGHIVESVMEGNEAVQAVVVRDVRQSGALTGRVRDGQWRLAEGTQSPAGEGLLTASSEVFLQGARIGAVEVWVTDRFERQAMNRFLVSRLLSVLAVNVVLAAVLWLIFRRAVVRPLKAVEAYALHVRDGEENARIPGGAFPEELESLRTSIESMVFRLKTRYLELSLSRAARAEAEERYRGIFENASEGIFQSSLDGEILVANPALARMFGYDSPAELIAQKGNARHMYADSASRDRFVSILISGGRVNDFVAQGLRGDGSAVWCSVSARLVRNDKGEPLFISGTTQDVTERKMAEDALRESETKYHALIENANDAVFVHSIREDGSPGPMLEVNEVACTRMGYTREEFSRMSPLELDDPRYLDRLPGVIERLRVEGMAVFETAHLARDGRSIPVEVSARTIVLQGQTAVISLARDITERKRAEDALRANQEKLSLAMDLAGVNTFEFDFASGSFLMDDRFFALAGTNAEREGGYRMSAETFIREFLLPEEAHLAVEAIAQGVEAGPGASLPPVELRLVRRDGEIRHTMTHRTVFFDASGRPVRAVGATRDITESKLAENALRANQQKLAVALDMAGMGAWEYDAATGLFEFDDQFFALYGTSCEREGGAFMTPEAYACEFFPPEDAHIMTEVMARTVAGPLGTCFPHVEHSIIRRDGEERFVLVHRRGLWDDSGKLFKLYGANQDITECKRTEAALRANRDALAANQEKLSLAMGLADIAEWEYDFSTGLFHFDDRFFALYGTSCEREGGAFMTPEEYAQAFVPHEEAHSVLDGIPAVMALAAGSSVPSIEHHIIRRDGVVRDIAVHAKPVWDESGRLVRIIGANQDITGRKQAEQALRESEERLRKQLDFILSPDVELDSQGLAGLLEAPALQSLIEVFVRLTGAHIGLIDTKGKVLISSGWQDICSKFHRVHPRTRANCVESDLLLTSSLSKGEYVAYKCRNNMWDVSTPVYIGDRHVANIYTGQFFYVNEEVDPEVFLAQADQYGFDKDAYMAALARVPRFSRAKVNAVMEFLVKLADLISSMGYGNLKLAKALWDQKLVEENLRANQEKLTVAMDMANLAPWEYDYAKGLFTFDDRYFAMYGTSCEREGGCSMTPETYTREFLPADDAPRIREGIDWLGLPGSPDTPPALEFTIIRRDGERRVKLSQCTVIRDEHGRALKLIGANQDITERKLAENALRESETRYRGLVETIPLGVAVISQDMRVLSMNAKMREWFTGVDIGQHPVCFRSFNQPPSEEACGYCPVVKTFRDGKIHESVTATPGKDGVRPFRVIACPILDAQGNVTAAIEIVEDITERAAAEDALRLSERKYRSLLDNLPLSIIYKDRNSTYLTVNASFAVQYGMTPEDFPGKTDFDLYPETLAEKYRTDDQRIMGSGITEEYDEPYIVDDQEMIVHTIKMPMRDETGRIESILIIFWDVTQNRRVEVAMREAGKMAAVGTLAGGIAHDFNNILGSIANLALLAKDDMPPDSDARQDLENILESANVGKDLVRQLLTFCRPGKEIRRNFDPATIVVKALKLLKSSIPGGIEIREDISGKAGMILADPTQFHQVTLNLCSNAVDAMRGKSGVLTVTLGKETVEEGAAVAHPTLKPGKYVTLSVTDTGPGIDPAIQERIFEPFFTTKPKGRGTGLGLSVVHGIAARHNGAVTVRSRPGEGTAFTVYFPACEEAQTLQEIPASFPVRGRGRILLVDDEEIPAQTGKRLLEKYGYTVTIRMDGAQALELFSNDPFAFDLLITDLTMPRMDGKKLAMEVLARRPEMPIILCTGYSEALSPEDAARIGIREYVHKPVNWDRLSAVIGCLL